MSDQDFQEIQLSGKQLFFLFMCAVVLAGGIFIFGVSVGRGVRNASGQSAQTDVPTDTTVPADAPAAPVANPNELSYAQALQGRGADPATVTPPTPPAEEPATAGTPAGTAAISATEPAKATASTPKTEASAPKTEAPAPKAQAPGAKTEPKPAPAAGGYLVQVVAFSANDVASREVAKLQRKGHPAFVFTAPDDTPGPRYKVQVGPFSTRAEADKTIKALRAEGYKPFIKL